MVEQSVRDEPVPEWHPPEEAKVWSLGVGVYAVQMPDVVGGYLPPFRTLERGGLRGLVLVNSAQPDILWVGLNTPKQERWMYEHRAGLRAPVIIGVGAAFDLNSSRL